MTKFLEVKSRATAKRKAPWAAKIVKAEGGFLAFQYFTDWLVWKMAK